MGGGVNSLAPGKFEWNFRYLIFKRIVVIDRWGISCEIAPIWMSLNFTDDQSALVQVMAWCCQATSHYLSPCWPRSLSPYGVTKPECVNSIVNSMVHQFHLFWLLRKCGISSHYMRNSSAWNPDMRSGKQNCNRSSTKHRLLHVCSWMRNQESGRKLSPRKIVKLNTFELNLIPSLGYYGSCIGRGWSYQSPKMAMYLDRE